MEDILFLNDAGVDAIVARVHKDTHLCATTEDWQKLEAFCIKALAKLDSLGSGTPDADEASMDISEKRRICQSMIERASKTHDTSSASDKDPQTGDPDEEHEFDVNCRDTEQQSDQIESEPAVKTIMITTTGLMMASTTTITKNT